LTSSSPIINHLAAYLVWGVDERISNLFNLRLNVGRRVIGAYFLTFLHSCPSVNSGADYSNIASNALNTYTLGEHVGREWRIGRVLRWKYMVDPQMISRGMDNRHVGLHKVLGTTVEAIVGGVYHQFVRLPFSSPLYRCTEPFSFPRLVGSRRSPQVLPHPSPSSHPPERHASRRSRRIPLTSYATLQEREWRRKHLITISTHAIK